MLREEVGRRGGGTHTTICLRPSRGLRMNLRVRSVTGESESAILAVGWRVDVGDNFLALSSRDREGFQWDFPVVVIFAGCCTPGVEPAKSRPQFG